MTTTRTLRNNEIENLPERIKRWCVYENEEEGCYHYDDVTITEYEDGIVEYDTSICGPYHIWVGDDNNMDVSVKRNGKTVFIYEEDEKKIDDKSASTYRIITFKNPESKVESKMIGKINPDEIKVYYRDGSYKTISLFDEEA